MVLSPDLMLIFSQRQSSHPPQNHRTTNGVRQIALWSDLDAGTVGKLLSLSQTASSPDGEF